MTDANGHIGRDKFLVRFFDPLNKPPNKPKCSYVRTSDTLLISATDPDVDELRYGVDWERDGTVDEWTAFVLSGTQQSINVDGRKGIVGIIAEDMHLAQSDWVSIKSKNKMNYQINSLFEIFLQRFSFIVKILN
jgi:hypothetical protein